MAHGYPVTLRLQGRVCVVVGGGKVASRKVRSLLEAGARVKVIAPGLTAELEELAGRGVIECELRMACPEDVQEAFLVICASDNAETNQCIGRAGLEAGRLVNVVDQPDLCNFYVPATVHRGAVTVAVSTDGVSPLVARRLREKLEEVVGPEYGQLAELLGRSRPEFQERCPDPAARLRAWDVLVMSPLLELLRAGQADEAEALVRAHLEAAIAEAAEEDE
jgi:precorrin-2 dehydrogenase/sirohydrochlorin ferrochelatase